MLATIKQIEYLQYLADRADFIKTRHPSLIPQGLDHIVWQLGITSEKANNCIRFYNEILKKAHLAMYPRRKEEELEDLPA